MGPGAGGTERRDRMPPPCGTGISLYRGVLRGLCIVEEQWEEKDNKEKKDDDFSRRLPVLYPYPL